MPNNAEYSITIQKYKSSNLVPTSSSNVHDHITHETLQTTNNKEYTLNRLR